MFSALRWADIIVHFQIYHVKYIMIFHHNSYTSGSKCTETIGTDNIGICTEYINNQINGSQDILAGHETGLVTIYIVKIAHSITGYVCMYNIMLKGEYYASDPIHSSACVYTYV